jgi:photosystem II stability/assembly factor-like uncharacterized protein
MSAKLLLAAGTVAVALAAAACSAGGGGPAFEPTAALGAPDILATRGGVVWSLVPNVGLNSVLRSTDGGRVWSDVLRSGRGRGLETGYFLGPDDAWVVTFHAHPEKGETSAVLGTSDGGRQWWRSRPPPADNGGQDQLFFADPRHGWLLGINTPYSGGKAAVIAVQLWRTTDGGHIWQRLRSGRLPLQGASVPGPSYLGCQPAIGFAGTEIGLLAAGSCQSGAEPAELWRTADGGASWRPVRLPAPARGWWHRGVDVGPPRVVATGHGRGEFLVPVADGPAGLVIEESRDGGLNWHIAGQVRTGAGPAAGTPAGWFHPLTAREWVISAPGRLIETADGGRTWRFLVSAESLTYTPASFTSLDAGYLQGTGLIAAMATSDAGRTWTAQQAPPSPATSPADFGGPAISLVQVVSSRMAVAAGWGGLLTSADGGRTWIRRLAVPSPVSQVDFVTARTGFAVADGELLRTLDGGAHWQAIPQPATGPVQSVDFWSAGQGVAFVYPDFLVTRDAGAHWRPLRLLSGWSIGPGGLANGPNGLDSPASGAVCFASNGTGWAIGRHHGRAVLVSPDGGRHWQVALPISALPQSAPGGLGVNVVGCSGQTAFVAVDASLNQYDPYDTTFDLLATADLGRSWLDVLRADNQQAPRPQVPATPGGPPLAGNPYGFYGPSLLLLSVPAPLTAWATECADSQGGCANLGLGVTADGGLTWRSDWFTPPGIGQPARWPFLAGSNWIATSALDAEHAWLLFEASVKGTEASYLFATDDGGATWRRVTTFG